MHDRQFLQVCEDVLNKQLRQNAFGIRADVVKGVDRALGKGARMRAGKGVGKGVRGKCGEGVGRIAGRNKGKGCWKE